MLYATPAIVSEQPTVRGCDVLFAERTDSPDGQKRIRVFAASDAEDGHDRVATAKWLAIKLVDTSNLDFVDVFLIPANGPRKREDLNATTAGVWLRFAPDPAKIPFMKAVYEVKYSSGPPDEHGNFWGAQTLTTLEARQLKTDKTVGRCDYSEVFRMLNQS